MADIKQAFGSSTALTITLASLANDAARESTAVDNATNLYLDALVYVALRQTTGTPTNQKACYVWCYGSEDGTNFTYPATGSDAAITLPSPHMLKLLGVVNMPTDLSATAPWKSHPMSVAQAFGGIMPRKWGIVIENQTGFALHATEGNHDYNYTGVYATG